MNTDVTLLTRTSAPDYAGRVSEIVQRITTAADGASALDLLKEATRRLGGEVAAFGSFIRDEPARESYRFLLACDAGWCCEYEQSYAFADDPWLAYAMKHTEPICASAISANNARQQAVIDLAARFKFRSTVVLPAPSSGGLSRVGALCVGSPVPGYFESEGLPAFTFAARSLAMHLHEWWIEQIKKEMISEKHITADDMLLLLHEQAGRGTKTIADVLGTSPGSINSRFQRLNEKLGVPNRKAAARLAAEYGLI